MSELQINEGLKLQKCDDVVSRKNANDIIVLMKMDDSSSFFKINGVAAEVWDLLSDGKSVKEVLDQLEGEYNVTREVLLGDVSKLITQLVDKNLAVTA
ncbi:hypothetical protein BMS_3131 [Halobacteriovorax marinus SJ]|uniref:PqqD family protein n=1 Tax=Halobacteriovorax marinus (strain ATCC BAA-682 / DSM 15412 / SJ) TaxID=862908 RepID=E1WZV2_HALMS|nr:PqqD family protein [Halobacteriovorax marinus]CBW27888.1 hypothetical protein BMS_3131 [Halobacteriovorax marinus SJ]